jgi:hypothetical protein
MQNCPVSYMAILLHDGVTLREAMHHTCVLQVASFFEHKTPEVAA